MEAKAPYRMNDAAKRAQERAKRIGYSHSAAIFGKLYNEKYSVLGGPTKRLCDMNGVEVSAVSTAMDSLAVMNKEARALMRVSQEVGASRAVKDVITEDAFIALCAARAS